MPQRRYELKNPELNEGIEDLLEAAEAHYGEREGVEQVRETLVTGLRLLRDGAERADLRMVNNALKELRHSFRVFAPYTALRKVAVFGSARTSLDHPDWSQAQTFAERIVREGWMVITGAGGGIMKAAQGGAGREASFGVNIRLPFEQKANEVIAGDPKCINFRYFFTRKVVFVKESHAIALFPGGYGTHDEALEALTLIQTGKGEMLPVVFVDEPGGSYWREWADWVRSHMAAGGFISEDDMNLFRVTDDVDVAVREMLNFYSNYHSSRYVGDQLVIRVRQAPDGDELETLNQDFKGILSKGAIEVRDALPKERGEVPEMARVVLHFDRRSQGRLRVLIDRLNDLVSYEFSTPSEAVPHQVVPSDLTELAEREEERED